MSEQELQEMKRKLDLLDEFIEIKGNRIILKKTVIVDGIVNADRVYTQRSGSYVELTS